MTTTERPWMAVPGWRTAHLLGPSGSGWKTVCGRYTANPSTPAGDTMPHCTECAEPRGATHQRPIIPRVGRSRG